MGYDPLALTALIVSLIALITTIQQVLQQYLASATDGYRRCKHSVMGHWGLKTYQSCNATHTPPLPPPPPPPPPTEKNKETVHTTDDERASWVTLLTVIQREERDSREWEKAEKNKRPPRGQTPKEPIYTIAHQIQEKTRSWDFMPAGTTKPYATTALTHLVEIVGLLGMYWKAFDVAKGDLTAEGNGCFFTSSLFEENRVIPSIDIKEWVFGFVTSILGQSREVRSVDGIERTLAKLKCGPEILKLYPEKKNSSYLRADSNAGQAGSDSEQQFQDVAKPN
ncbi:hypothetical protein B0J14DRAFT_684413 [Halenospora varia]|nr:hypothetical protein B0J14DRAFT_684413 [Halenospora varia]